MANMIYHVIICIARIGNFIELQFPAGNYMFKVSTRKGRTRCEIYSRLTIKAPERRIFIFKFENIPHLVLVFLLLTLSR